MCAQDTGSKPHICKECGRPFARQDALTRHEKLHLRASNANYAPQTTSLMLQSPLIDSLQHWDSNSSSSAVPTTPSEPSHSSQTEYSELQNTSLDLDFDLIWPDSENLLQSLMSSDTTDQWQMPLGTLPSPPVVQDISGLSLGSPDSFDDRSSSLGPIPSGGSRQAVHDVTEMGTSSVSHLTAWHQLKQTHNIY